MGNRKMGIVVAGNEYNKVDTLKILATAVSESDNMIGQVVGQGMLDNAEAIANSPAYMEAVEVLGLYLAEYGTGSSDEVDELKEDIAELERNINDLDDENNELLIENDRLEMRIAELEEDSDEEEEEEEETVTTCHECGEVVSTKKGTYLAGYFFCKDCVTTAWTEV